LAFGFAKMTALVKRPVLVAGIFLLLTGSWLTTDWQLLTDPYRAPIPESDRSQYLNAWPAGGGIRETVVFLNQESQKGKILAVTEGTFGLLPAALEIYLFRNQNIEIKGFWPLEKELPEEITVKAKDKPTYLITNRLQAASTEWPVTMIARFPKGIGKDVLTLYKVY
jgi:hypothetical protein